MNERNMVIEVPQVKYPTWYSGDTQLSTVQQDMASRAPVPAVRTMDRNSLIHTSMDFDKQMETASNQAKQMALAVAKANVLERNAASDFMFDYFGKVLKGYERPQVPAIRAQDVAQGLPALQQHVGNSLVSAWHQFVGHVGGILNQFVTDGQVGVINWYGDDACSYHFFENKYVRSNKHETVYRTHVVHGLRHREETTVRETMKIWNHTNRHEHDLVDAHAFPLDDCPVRVPQRLLPVLRSIPPVLRPYAKIVAGNQIYQGVFPSIGLVAKEDKDEVQVREWVDPPPVQAQVWRPDPAIVLGHFVLGAWDDSEV